MHPKSNHQSEYVKTIETAPSRSPLVRLLNQTGLDVEDLSVVSCIKRYRLDQICRDNLMPTKNEIQLLAMGLRMSVSELAGMYKN